MLLKFIPQDTKINFISLRYVAMIISLALVLGSVALVGVRGLNLGIDFTGGTLIEIATDQPANIAQLRTELQTLYVKDLTIQSFGTDNDLLIRFSTDPEIVGEQDVIEIMQIRIEEALAPQEVEFRRAEYVGPQVGEELKKAGLIAFILSLSGIMVYIWFRFEWRFAVAALMALIHDTVAVFGFFSLTQATFDLSTLAAVLLVAGYSINDTVVVFDRIRENMRKFKKKPLGELLNLSINQMLARTLTTSVTTLLALGALFAFGGPVIQGFVEALLFGIILGTYSSIYVAGPLLMMFKNTGKTIPDSEEGST